MCTNFAFRFVSFSFAFKVRICFHLRASFSVSVKKVLIRIPILQRYLFIIMDVAAKTLLAATKKAKKEKKKKSSSSASSSKREKKEKSSSSSPAIANADTDANKPAAEPVAASSAAAPRGAFYYGELFAKYTNGEGASGTMSRDSFLRCLSEEVSGRSGGNNPATSSLSMEEEFKAGEIFQRYAASGVLGRESFMKVLDEIRRGASSSAAAPGGDEASRGGGGLRAVLVPDAALEGNRNTAHPLQNQTENYYVEPPHHINGAINNNRYQGVQLVPERTFYSGAAMDPHIVAVRDDYTRLQGALQATLGPRRDQEVFKLNHIDSVAEEIRSIVRDIETDTRTDADAIVGRVRTHGNNKIRALHQIRSRILETLRGLDHFHTLAMGPRPLDALRHEHVAPPTALMKVMNSTQSAINGRAMAPSMPPAPAAPSAIGTHTQPEPRPEAMVQFIRHYGEIDAALQRLISKPAPDDGDTMRVIMQDDYPRDVAERRAKSARLDASVQSLSAKDAMIQNLLQERKEYERQKIATLAEVDDLSRASSLEIAEWVKLSDKIAEEMGQKLKMAAGENARLKRSNEHLEQRVSDLMRETARLRAICPPGI